jgi:Arm domain-containing DNA-binding protein
MFVKSNRGWLALAHIPYGHAHFDEYLGLKDTRDNRREAERIKRGLEAAMLAGSFETEFARRFPDSKNLARFDLAPVESTLADFAVAWLEEQTHLTAASTTTIGFC